MAFINSLPVVSSSSSTSTQALCRSSFTVSCARARVPARVFANVDMQEADLPPPPADDLDMDDSPAGQQQDFAPQRSDEERIPEDAKLFVGNLSWNTTDSTLGAAFEHYGTVIDARVITDKFTGKSRGFGFIEFDNGSSADNALTGMDGVEIDGRPVRVDRANRRAGGNARGARRY